MPSEFLVSFVFVSVTLFFFLLENLYPLREKSRSLVKRLMVNLTFAAIAFITISLSVKPVTEQALTWIGQSQIGFSGLFPLPAIWQALLSFLLLDLSFYWWHRANHKIPLLWRFHNIHHTDPDLDISTTFRFHFVELLLSSAFRMFQILVIAPSAWIYLSYEVIFQINTLFHHSNVRLPLAYERRLNFLLVTPRMHGIHHSRIKDETNTNYASVFSCWDRLHRTLCLNVPQKSINIGVAAYQREGDNRIGYMLTLPFQKQRNYWQSDDKSQPTRGKTFEYSKHLAE